MYERLYQTDKFDCINISSYHTTPVCVKDMQVVGRQIDD